MRERWARRLLAASTVATLAVAGCGSRSQQDQQSSQNPHEITVTLGIGRSVADTKIALTRDCIIRKVTIKDFKVTLITDEPNCTDKPKPPGLPQEFLVPPSTLTLVAPNVAVVERGTGTYGDESKAREQIDSTLQESCGEVVESVPLRFGETSRGDILIFPEPCTRPISTSSASVSPSPAAVG
jgi:hypothetical protein